MANNILYIEDNPDNMTLVQRALEARGYRLLKAMNGLDGVAVAESEQVDLILLDINLRILMDTRWRVDFAKAISVNFHQCRSLR